MSNRPDLKFRVIRYQSFDGALNMALDEAILNHYMKGLAPPTLRFYGWSPDAVSIGYGQNLPGSQIDRLKRANVDVVRRPTGGRAVLHKNEFTYSFVAASTNSDREGAILAPSINEAYRQICQGIILGLRKLGLNVELGETSKGYKDFQDCFLATTTADLHVGGRKLVGSAQLRRQEAVLQHGSIILNQPYDLMPELLGRPASPERKAPRHANLFDELKREVPLKELEDALILGFEEAFQSDFEEGSLSPDESDEAAGLKEKYLVDKVVSELRE